MPDRPAMIRASPPSWLAPWRRTTRCAARSACRRSPGTRRAPSGLVDHNDKRSEGHSGYVGENIYGSSGTATGPAAVSSWASESANYNYNSNQCTGVCGHYTQLVWRETLRVGCALHRCAGLTYAGTVVCNYGPGGNSHDRRPY
jgi:hypothetical protein